MSMRRHLPQSHPLGQGQPQAQDHHDHHDHQSQRATARPQVASAPREPRRTRRLGLPLSGAEAPYAPLPVRPANTTARDNTLYHASVVGDAYLALARLLAQADRDTSGASLRRVMTSAEYGESFWGLRELGEAVRREAARNLYAVHGARGIVPDPRRDLPYSARSLLEQVCYDHGIEPLRMTPPLQQAALRYSQDRLKRGDRPIYAWLELDADDRHPILVADTRSAEQGSEPPHIHAARWTFDAAQVIGLYLCLAPHMDSAMAPSEPLTPPDPVTQATRAPLAHQFAKALLGLEPECPTLARCHCNHIVDLATRVPPAHPQATGALVAGQLARQPGALDTPRPRAIMRPALGE